MMSLSVEGRITTKMVIMKSTMTIMEGSTIKRINRFRLSDGIAE
jgi:hypothetical protein